MRLDGNTINGLFGEERKRTARQREAELQRACVRWFRLQYPQYLLFHVPNGGRRNAREAAFLKSEGVTAGIPDLFLAEGRHGFHGLFIEMKAGKNTATPAQKEMMGRLGRAGYLCAVCRSFEEFQIEVMKYLQTL